MRTTRGREPTDAECVKAMEAINASFAEGVPHQAVKRALEVLAPGITADRLLFSLGDLGWVRISVQHASGAVELKWPTFEGLEIGAGPAGR